MEIAKTIFVFIHILGLAALIGGALVQWNTTNKQASPTMLWGVRVQLISGLILWVLVANSEQHVQHLKFLVKLSLTAVIAGILESSRRSLSTNGYGVSLGVAILNVALSLFWQTTSEG
jgi:hypothetical protein